jgi:hypothetical protein
MPDETMLCTLWVRAMTPDGTLLARNYVQFFVDAGFPERQEIDRGLVLRRPVHAWTGAEWSGGHGDAAEAEVNRSCYGNGHGFFEYQFPIGEEDLRSASKIRVICEASARRDGTPQTDAFAQPTSFRMLLNGVRIYTGILPNHPHDSSGALSYVGDGRGGYGYLAHSTVDGELLRQVIANAGSQSLYLHCVVRADQPLIGGLTLYGGESGRSPLPPTLIIERA